MTNGIDSPPPAGAPAEVSWRQLRRVNAHRTSKPTDDMLRRVVGEITAVRGNAPAVDAVIFAALRLAMTPGRDLRPLLDMVREIETDSYPGPRASGEPGE